MKVIHDKIVILSFGIFYFHTIRCYTTTNGPDTINNVILDALNQLPSNCIRYTLFNLKNTANVDPS